MSWGVGGSEKRVTCGMHTDLVIAFALYSVFFQLD